MDVTDLALFSRTTILVMVFVITLAVGLAVVSVINARVAVKRRLEERLSPSGAANVSLRRTEGDGAWVKMVNAIEKRGLSLVDTNDDKLRARLIAAGYTNPAAPRFFTFIRLILALGIPLGFVVLSYALGEPPSLLKLYFIGSFFGLLGLYGPNLFISAKAERRKSAIINGFPDALDLMLVCVEAGLGLEAAFSRVGTEMMRSHPLLSEMLGGVVLELRAGRSREDALRRMADRVQIDEIRSFATLLIQSSKLGSSVAQTLRVYAAEMREGRKLRAEEKAHRLPVLISIPLVACMLPAMIGVLMLPAGIRVVRQLLPAMAGG